LVGGSHWNNGLCNSNVHHGLIMKPLTPELRKEIEESGVPLIDISMEELQSSIVGIVDKPLYINKKANKNG